MLVSVLTELGDRHHSVILECLCPPLAVPLHPCPPPTSHPSPKQPLTHFPSLSVSLQRQILAVVEQWNRRCVVSNDCLLSLSKVFAGVIRAAVPANATPVLNHVPLPGPITFHSLPQQLVGGGCFHCEVIVNSAVCK